MSRLRQYTAKSGKCKRGEVVAWIKSYQELRHHPKASRLSRFCGIPLAQAIGHLHIFWWSALDYAQDGDLSALDDEEIAALAGWDGDAVAFVEALNKAGFIDKAGGGYAIHDWGEYAGRLIDDRERKREQDRERARTYRDRQKERHATVTHDGKSRHATIAQGEKTREDKTKADESREATPLPPSSGGIADGDEPMEQSGFDRFWGEYPKKQGKGAALKAWSRIRPGKVLVAKILNVVEQSKHSEQWRRDNGQFIPNPATWLNQGRWDDEIAGKQGTSTAKNYDEPF